MSAPRNPLSAKRFQLKPRQKEDLARAATHDGLIFAWDTGLGKSLGAYLWCLLKVGYTVPSVPSAPLVPTAPVLIIGLADGLTHFQSEAALLGLKLIPLDSQETFHRLCTQHGTRATLPPGFYYTTFTQLTRNGVAPPPEDLHEGCNDSHVYPHGKIKCIYDPTLADLLTLQPFADIFQCVVVDEGVRMKGAATLVGTGIRQLQPRFRLVTTATPIKNRLPDVFFLAAWACAAEEANARWPYNNCEKEQQKFAENFLIMERNLTKEAIAKANRKPSRYRKLSAEVCNVHGLWKLFAPVILRRRKADMLADIPSKESHIIRVPMGKAQAETYRYHLNAHYRDKNGKPAHGAKLQALRVTAANPCSPLLLPEREAVAAYDSEISNPQISNSEPASGPFRSTQSHTPKLAACLNLVAQILDNKEQCIIGSVFPDSLDVISSRLDDAGVTHLILDGRTPPSRRGQLALLFKSSKIPVLLAGVESMAEMHSFPQCCNAILYSYSWAWDKFEQFINRIHRINSPGPVHVWSILSDGSIDRKLDELRRQKGDSQELVLDGKLFTRAESEVNLAELVAAAETEFDPASQTIDEARLELEWPLLRNRLRTMAACWSNQHGARPSDPGSPVVQPDSVPNHRRDLASVEPADISLPLCPPAIDAPALPLQSLPSLQSLHSPTTNPLRNYLLARLRRSN